MARKRKKDDDEGRPPLAERVRDSTLCVPANEAKCSKDFPGLLANLRLVVKENNEMMYCGGLLALGYVTSRLAHGDSLPPQDKDFYMACYKTVSSNARPSQKATDKYPDLAEVCQQIFGAINFVDVQSNKNIVVTSATAMQTAVSNYNTVALKAHLATYLQAKYRIPRKGHANFLRDRIMAQDPFAFGEESKVAENLVRELDWTLDTLNLVIHIENELYREMTSWGRFTEYRFLMLKEIAAASTDERTYKSFELLPLPSVGVKFIDLDLSTLKNYIIPRFYRPVKRARKANNQSQPDLADYEEKLEAIKSLDDLFRRPKRKGWVKGLTMRTNGYEFHFVYERNKPRVEQPGRGFGRARKVADRKKQEEADWQPEYKFVDTFEKFDRQNASHFAASDVGNTNVFTVVSPDPAKPAVNGKDFMEKRNFSKVRYCHDARRDKKMKWTQRLSEQAGVKEAETLLATHSLKTVDFSRLCEAIRVRTRVAFSAVTPDKSEPLIKKPEASQRKNTNKKGATMPKTRKDFRNIWWFLYNVYGNHQYMKFTAAARRLEFRTRDTWLNEMTWGGTKALGVGDCSRHSGIKGTSVGGPVKKILRHGIKKGFNITMVNEAYTSKRSCCCLDEDMRPVRRSIWWASRKTQELMWDEEIGDFKCKEVEIYGLRVCNGCGKTWDRDFVGACNIFTIFHTTTVLGGPRPAHFTKHGVPRPVPDGHMGDVS